MKRYLLKNLGKLGPVSRPCPVWRGQETGHSPEILRRYEFSMKKRLNLKRFTARIETATRKAGFTVAERQGTTLTVILHNQPVRCNLETAYQSYQNAPDRLDDIIEAHLNALGRVPPPPPPPTEAEAAESLLPMLQSQTWVVETKKADIPLLAQRPFVAGLIITYVLEIGRASCRERV